MTANSPATAEVDVQRLIDDLIEIASRLIAVMEKETALLRDMRPKEIVSFQEEKARLIRGYEEKTKALRAEPAQIAAITGAIKQELTLTIRHFEHAAELNAKALAAAKEANERLLKAIINAATESRADTQTYSSDGALRRAGNGKSEGVSLALNQEL